MRKKKKLFDNKLAFIFIIYALSDFLLTNFLLFLIEKNYLYFSFLQFAEVKGISVLVLFAFVCTVLLDNEKLTEKLKKVLIIGSIVIFAFPYFFCGNFIVANERQVMKYRFGINTVKIQYENLKSVEVKHVQESGKFLIYDRVIYVMKSNDNQVIEVEFPPQSSSVFTHNDKTEKFEKIIDGFVSK